jgi:hypothetical protein
VQEVVSEVVCVLGAMSLRGERTTNSAPRRASEMQRLEFNGGRSMLTKSIAAAVVLVGVIVATSMSPASAAKWKHTPMPCAKAEQRCIADCDKDHWCHKYQCINNQTVLLPFACLETSGTCYAPHC